MSNATQSGNPSERNNGTSTTEFGKSVESTAQIEDAEKIASGGEPGEILNIYRLVPKISSADGRVNNQHLPDNVVVAARTAGDARIVAAGRELDFLEVDAAPSEDVTTRHASVFRDEKIYSVVEIEHWRADLRRGVLSGEIPTDTIKPTQL